MKRLLPKAVIATMLIVASLLQGWPLLVAAMCTMSEPQTMSRMGACCCCDDTEQSTASAFTSCTPGKTLAGILSTDPSLQPVKEKTKSDSLPLSPVLINNLLDAANGVYSSGLLFCSDQTTFGHAASPPLYLLDSVYRI